LVVSINGSSTPQTIVLKGSINPQR